MHSNDGLEVKYFACGGHEIVLQRQNVLFEGPRFYRVETSPYFNFAQIHQLYHCTKINKYISNIKSRGYHKIVHFACERDFSSFRNHAYSKLFEPTHVSRKAHSHKFSSRNMYYTSDCESFEIGWFEQCSIRMISNHWKISVTSTAYYFMVTPRTWKSLDNSPKWLWRG